MEENGNKVAKANRRRKKGAQKRRVRESGRSVFTILEIQKRRAEHLSRKQDKERR